MSLLSLKGLQKGAHNSLMSYGLIGAFVVVFLWEWLLQLQYQGFSFGISGEMVYRLGGNESQAIGNGEVWRLFTAVFLHLDFLHLGMNSLAMYYFGPFLERTFGSGKLLLAFVVTGVAGSWLTFLMHAQQPYLSAGASGGLYGLFGVMFISGKRYKHLLPVSFQTWLNQTMGILIIFSFAPHIDIWGHFGGLLSGLILGWWYKPLVIQVQHSSGLDQQYVDPFNQDDNEDQDI